MILDNINQELLILKEKKNYRSLPQLTHEGRDVIVNGQRMLNLSSNDYLGLANDLSLREEFLKNLTPESFLPTSSSSRLLTGNYTVYEELEQQLSTAVRSEGMNNSLSKECTYCAPPIAVRSVVFPYALSGSLPGP